MEHRKGFLQAGGQIGPDSTTIAHEAPSTVINNLSPTLVLSSLSVFFVTPVRPTEVARRKENDDARKLENSADGALGQ